MKKFETYAITTPTFEKSEDGRIDFNINEPTNSRDYAKLACVTNQTDFAKDVQRYIDMAYSDKFNWLAEKCRVSANKGNVVAGDNAIVYNEMANYFKPDNKKQEMTLARIIAFVICKECRTYYYCDGDKYKKCDVTFGNDGIAMFEAFQAVSDKTVSDKAVSELKERLTTWFQSIIANDPNCKEWDCKGITAKITLELIHEAGRIYERYNHKGIADNSKRTSVSEWTNQALLKCLKKVLKFEPHVEYEHVHIIQ